jgi:hypothetical protein
VAPSLELRIEISEFGRQHRDRIFAMPTTSKSKKAKPIKGESALYQRALNESWMSCELLA